jgi:hypothetical protein
MRRRRRNATVRYELGEGVDHFRRAATIAAQGTGASVGPKFNAARGRVQPAAVRAKDAASTSWEAAVARLMPLIIAAAENARLRGRRTVTISKQQAKANRRNARKLEERASRALGRKPAGRTPGRLFGLALAGTAVGAGAAYLMRRRRAAQWDEYDPNQPIGSTQEAGGADDAAFEPVNKDTGDQTATPPR